MAENRHGLPAFAGNDEGLATIRHFHFTIEMPPGPNPRAPGTLPIVTGDFIMAYASHYRQVFDVPVAGRRRDVSAVFRDPAHASLIELEFSNYGRNPRFQPGWYILPAVVTGMAIIAAVLVLI
jgi:hypothetical protein